MPLRGVHLPGNPLEYRLGLLTCLVTGSAILYSLRKRIRFLPKMARADRWLQFHAFAGSMGVVLAALHWALRRASIVESGALAALAAMVVSGMAGRRGHSNTRRRLRADHRHPVRATALALLAESRLPWRTVHVAAAVAFGLLSLVHIIAVYMY